MSLSPCRVSPEVAGKITYTTTYNNMYKTRRKTVPIIPQTLPEFGTAILNAIDRFGKVDGNTFFQAVVGEGDSLCILFVVSQLAYLLRSGAEWHMDATFKSVPKVPKTLQLLTIMAVYQAHVSFGL